ncbi:MAG: sterol desaturase family protein [Shewanella sp.]|nr:sterol desaturase family protein [Shewanella sp.]MCF1430469.1 sterol desaturase family protein [Shewanella sp.]MCF1438281.1 sterol desaturase family protein [Shewanella sp.]MCF1458142.1 sterol desaturase family protein [Shewanella sp.]
MDILLQHPDWLLLVLAPVFLLAMVLEWRLGSRGGKLPVSADYQWREVACNIALGGLHQLSDLLFGLLILKFYFTLFDWRLFDIQMNFGYFLLLMLAQDFCYYWFHRASHRIRWFWAAHSVHHSSENMNFSTAFRQSLMYPVAGMWIFWVPLVIIGFPPNWVVLSVLLNLALQFVIHTQWIKDFGPLDLFLNSPSHHRVHHGRNPQYIDKNYAGVLIIWDRLFGTFVPERESVDYGITKPVNSHNPLVVTFSEWRDMLREAMAPGLSWRSRLAAVFAPPQNYGLAKGEDRGE